MDQAGLEASKALVRRFAEVVNRGDYALLDELVASDFVRHCQATPEVTVRSREDFKRYLVENHATFPDEHMREAFLVAEGDKVAFYSIYSGTQQGPMGAFPPSGKRMELDISGLFRVVGGKLAELWVTWDNVTGLVQLGHFPPPAAQ
jgi:steroid delta-isomerase-like uncharacterized protein